MKRAFAIGLGLLGGGIALYVGTALVMVNHYGEQPRPAWINALWLVAAASVALGLLVMVNGAVRAYRERT